MAQPARLAKVENASPKGPPTVTGKPASDRTPGGAAAGLVTSAIGNARTPLRMGSPVLPKRVPPPASQNVTTRRSPIRPANGAKLPLTFENAVRSETGSTHTPVTTMRESLLSVPKAFRIVGRFRTVTLGGGDPPKLVEATT
jgi:hypothetical protein